MAEPSHKATQTLSSPSFIHSTLSRGIIIVRLFKTRMPIILNPIPQPLKFGLAVHCFLWQPLAPQPIHTSQMTPSHL
jgi:hypothetical protein